MKPSSFIYWSRFFIAIATGAGSVLALGGNVSSDIATVTYVAVAAVVYALTAVFYRYVLHYDATQLKGKNRYITLGIGTFIFAYIATLIMTYTLLGL